MSKFPQLFTSQLIQCRVARNLWENHSQFSLFHLNVWDFGPVDFVLPWEYMKWTFELIYEYTWRPLLHIPLCLIIYPLDLYITFMVNLIESNGFIHREVCSVEHFLTSDSSAKELGTCWAVDQDRLMKRQVIENLRGWLNAHALTPVLRLKFNVIKLPSEFLIIGFTLQTLYTLLQLPLSISFVKVLSEWIRQWFMIK